MKIQVHFYYRMLIILACAVTGFTQTSDIKSQTDQSKSQDNPSSLQNTQSKTIIKFDPNTVKKVKIEVFQLIEANWYDSKYQNLVITPKEQVMLVDLGKCKYLKNKVKQGDELIVTGSAISSNGVNYLLASEVTFSDGKNRKIRDSRGFPLWLDRHSNQGKGDQRNRFRYQMRRGKGRGR